MAGETLAFHEPFRRKVKKVELEDMNVPSTSNKQVLEEALHKHPEQSENATNATESSDGLVREALDAAYAKHGEKLKAQSVSITNCEETKQQSPPIEGKSGKHPSASS